MKRRVAICGGREAVADFVQGGGQIDPPPPVKIGLMYSKFRNVPICQDFPPIAPTFEVSGLAGMQICYALFLCAPVIER